MILDGQEVETTRYLSLSILAPITSPDTPVLLVGCILEQSGEGHTLPPMVIKGNPYVAEMVKRFRARADELEEMIDCEQR